MKENFKIIVLILAAICLAIIAIIKKQEQREIEFNQAIDLTMKIEKMACGDSLLLTNLTHPYVLKKIEKQLEKSDKEIWLGNAVYNSFGMSYSKNPNYSEYGKFIYALDRGSNSRYELLIEDRMIYNQSYQVKCLLIYVVCD